MCLAGCQGRFEEEKTTSQDTPVIQKSRETDSLTAAVTERQYQPHEVVSI